MKNSEKNKLSLSYAKAVYEAAANTKNEDKVFSDFNTLKAAIKADAHIMVMLSNPLWQSEAKKKALQEISEKFALNQVTANFLMTVAENNRLSLLPLIFDDYKDVYYKTQNMVEVSVTSAVTLSTEQNKNLQMALEKWLKQKVVINYKIEPEILGGLLVECNSIMFDDSVKGKLEKLKYLMKGNN